MQDATDDTALDDAIVEEPETEADMDAAIDAVELEHLPDEEGVSDPITTARRRHGTAGAVLAAGLFGIDVALGRKPREDIPVVVSSNSDPTDIDTDGIRVDVDEQTTVVAPALPRQEPPGRSGRRRRQRRTT